MDDSDTLYRCLMYAEWYDEADNRVSTAAFSWPVFSVDAASLAGSPENTLARFNPGTGIVLLACGEVIKLVSRVVFEPDDRHPDNAAHAHVYTSPRNGERKKIAKRLQALCGTPCRKPNFANASKVNGG